MHRRDSDESLSSFPNTIDYFRKLIQAREFREKQNSIQYQNFLANLELLGTCVTAEFYQALANNDIATQNYIINFSKKLETLKTIVETSSSYEELNDALDNVINAAKRPIGVSETITTIASVIAGIAGAVVGAVVGTIVGAFTYGLIAAGTFGFFGVALAFVMPEAYLFGILGSAAVGTLPGMIGGAAEGAKFAYETTQQKMQTYHSTNIEDTTIALFKACKDSSRYNSHLFFPNKTAKNTEEKNCNLKNISSFRGRAGIRAKLQHTQ